MKPQTQKRDSLKLIQLMTRFSLVTTMSLLLYHPADAKAPVAKPVAASTQTINVSSCNRACLSGLVDTLLQSMVKHDPDLLPLDTVYRATENSHPSALGMMTSWRTITEAHKADFVAIDATAGQVFFKTQVNEAGNLSVLWGRFKVVGGKISEIELYLNRSRGDHGFSFSAEKLPENLTPWMNPPAERRRASRAELEALSRSVFSADNTYSIDIADDCSFIESGSVVIDPGLDDVPAPETPVGEAPRDPNGPLGCIMPPMHPTDAHARQIVIDEELGIVVDAAVVPGYVFPYPWYGKMYSAFIPSQMEPPTIAQQQWFERKASQLKGPLLKPAPATGEAMHVLQVYDGKLHGMQINVFVGPPRMQSSWVQP